MISDQNQQNKHPNYKEKTVKESDVITRSDIDFETLKMHVESVVAQAVEDYFKDDDTGNEAVEMVEMLELAAFIDMRLRKDGIAMKFGWLWSRAVTAFKK